MLLKKLPTLSFQCQVSSSGKLSNTDTPGCSHMAALPTISRAIEQLIRRLPSIQLTWIQFLASQMVPQVPSGVISPEQNQEESLSIVGYGSKTKIRNVKARSLWAIQHHQLWPPNLNLSIDSTFTNLLLVLSPHLSPLALPSSGTLPSDFQKLMSSCPSVQRPSQHRVIPDHSRLK